jgi:hypothetical protein
MPAFAFGHMTHLARKKGGNAVRASAYNMRAALQDERSGLKFNFRRYSASLEYHEILLPDGAYPKFADPATLWSAVELAERRSDATVARGVLLGLPADAEITAEDRAALVREFVQRHFVDKGLGAQINIHSASSDKVEYGNKSYHAHVLLTTRQVEGDRLSDRKAVMDGWQWRGRGIAVVSDEFNLTNQWRDFQNDWFSRHGKGLRVDPTAIFPQAHLGPKRFQHPLDERVQARAEIYELNERFARDPQVVVDHLSAQGCLDDKSITRFLGKYIEDPMARAEVMAKVKELQATALAEAGWAAKVPSGWRDLTVEDVARELSPKYAALLTQAKALKETMRRSDWVQERRNDDIVAAPQLRKDRWDEMGAGRRLLHKAGVVHDLELGAVDKFEKGAERSKERHGIKWRAASDQLEMVERLSSEELERVRPRAEFELKRRQRIADNARREIDRQAEEQKLARRKTARRAMIA